MGVLDTIKSFFANRREKRNEKSLRLIKNPKAIREDRVAALDYFKEHKDPAVSVPALLQRFEYSLEHGINDAREKEVAMDGILRHKEKSLPFVQEHLGKSLRIAWPIKVLGKLAGEADVANILIESLNFGDVSFDQAVVDKNYDILCYLADYKIAGLAEKLAHFLRDPDERVRFAAVEVLVRQDDHHLPQLLEPFISDESAENRRIRATVISAFVSRGWRVNDAKRYGEAPIVEGVFVTKDGHLERRNV